jgi:heptosyltransferase-2
MSNRHSTHKRIAVIKPDHLGDFVLSVPAVWALIDAGYDIELFIDKNVSFLANYLFPTIQKKFIKLAHLSKEGESEDLFNLKEIQERFDYVVGLRNDKKILNQSFYSSFGLPFSIVESSYHVHETASQKASIYSLVGNYEIADKFYRYGFLPKNKPNRVNSVGLCISAGFLNNSLSLFQWFDQAMNLITKGVREIAIVFGPKEKEDAYILHKIIFKSFAFKSGHLKISLLPGSADVALFLKKLNELDLLMATDSGTAHIASLSGVPIVSFFGPSPYNQYRPIGKNNDVVTNNLSCSPCSQFEAGKGNACLTKECMTFTNKWHQ